MDICIRSQNKEVITITRGVHYGGSKTIQRKIEEKSEYMLPPDPLRTTLFNSRQKYEDVEVHFIRTEDDSIVGEYKTKERAIEVLDEIDEIIKKSLGQTYAIAYQMPEE